MVRPVMDVVESSDEEWTLEMETSKAVSDESQFTLVEKKRKNSPKKLVGVLPKRIRKMQTCQRCGQTCQNVGRHMASAKASVKIYFCILPFFFVALCLDKPCLSYLLWVTNLFLHTTIFIFLFFGDTVPG